MKRKPLLFLLLMALFAPLAMNGQQTTLTVYDGTVTNSTVPAYMGYFDDFTRSQYVIPATALESLGDSAVISSLKFYSTSSNVPYPGTGVTPAPVVVYLKEVNYTSISAFEATASASTVYTGTLAVVAEENGGSMTIDFDTPFIYHNGNLLVGIENTDDEGYQFIYFYGQTVTGASVAGSNGSSLSGVSPTQRNFIPKTTFTYKPGTISSCPRPTNLVVSNVTNNSAVLTWKPGGDETEWMVEYKTADATSWTLVPGTVSDTTYTLTDLAPGTGYEARVQASCNEGKYVSTSFTTKCNPNTTFPWSEDFEGYSAGNFVDPCWVNEHISGGGTQIFKIYASSNGTNTTKQLQLPDMTSGTMTKLVLPGMSIPTGVVHEFDIDVYRNTNSSSYSGEGIRVYASTNGEIEGATELAFISRNYTTVYAVNNDTIIPAENGSGWYTYKLPIPFTGTCYIILRGESKYGSSTYMDNFVIREKPSCVQPTALVASEETGTTAKLTWTANGDEAAWDIYYSTSATAPTSETTPSLTAVGTNPYTLTNLTPSTMYYAWVRANCGGSVSDWSASCSFATACPEYATVPFTETFDSYAGGSGSSNSLPLCWDYINTTTYSYYAGYPTIYNGSSYSHSGNNHLRFYIYNYSSYDPQPQYAILPAVENLSNMRVRLYARANSTSGYYSTYDATFKIGVMEGNNFVEIASYTPASTSYQMYTTSFENYTGTGTHIAVMIDPTNMTTNYLSVYIDDVTVEPLPDCATPTGLVLVTNSQTPEGATIKWNNVEGASWIVEYKKAADTEWTAISPAVTDTIYTFMGLEPSTGYQARVSVVCTGITYPTDPVNFNTQMACPAPTNFTVRDLTDSSVTLAWRPGYDEEAWTVIYKKSTESTWPTEGTRVSDTTIMLSNLDGNTTYNVRISGCDETHYLSGSFTTKNPCAAPTALVVSNITNNSATLSWTPGYQETEWTVLYWQEEATDTLRRVVNDSPTIRLTDLRAFTTYNVRVINCENALAGSFVTATVVPLIEAFANTSAPKGWNKYTGLLEYVLSDSIQLSSTTGGWSFNTRNGVLDGVHVYGNIYGSSFKYWLVTPTVLMENNVDLRFDLALTDYNNADPIEDPTAQADDRFVVLISVNGGNWTILREWNNTGSEYVYNTISTTGEKVVCDLSSYAGQYVSIAFYGESTVGQNGDNDLHFDNVSIDYIPSCEKPLGLAVADSTITATSAVATWEAGNATKWNLQYKRTTDTVWIPVNGLTEATYTFDTLVGGTSYEVQVQADCGDNGTSAWTDSKLFTTKLCSPEDMCEITFVLTDAWGDSWNNAYIEVIDVLTGITLGEVANENLNGTSGSGENEVNIKTLAVCDGREIQFVWHTGSYDNEASYVITSALGDEIINGSGGFSTPVNYIVNCTLDPCDAPNGLAAETTYNSAALSWNGAAENYYVRYREAGVNIENFTQVGADETTTADYVLYTYDLSSYNGQSGYIAIRHYNCTDQNLLLIDDVTLNNGTDNVFSYNFDNGVLPNGIEFYDMDGDGFNWDLDEIYQYDYDEWEYIYYAHSGTYCLYSASYDSDEGGLTPDNWIILPYVEDLGCTLTFYARGFDSGYPDEVFGVFVTTEQNFVNEWINVPDIVSDTSYNLTGLNSLTTYEYQVQAADSECDDPQWSVSQEFTTLNGSVFITDGPWNVGSNWLNGSVPAEGADVIINANAVIPAEYTANVDEVTLSEGGSITIADGGQLFYGSDNLVVTMEKTISAYTDANGTGNYYLLAFPFRDNLEVPAAMTAAEGNDFYTFDNSMQGEEWQNNRQQASAIEEVTAFEGYLYANPSSIDLSFTGTTFGSPSAGYGYANTYTYDADENEESGWLLLGNPLTCNAYIYGQVGENSFPMDVMYYDADGVMQTVSAGPVAPMQGFFVKITEDTKVWFMGVESNAKSAPKPVNRGTMPVKMNLHKVVPVEK